MIKRVRRFGFSAVCLRQEASQPLAKLQPTYIISASSVSTKLSLTRRRFRYGPHLFEEASSCSRMPVRVRCSAVLRNKYKSDSLGGSQEFERRVPGDSGRIHAMRTAILLLALARFARLQEPTGTIMGMAQDLSGAVVSGVHVRVVSTATGWPWQTVTSDQGTYSITSLPAGEYTVSAEAAGFPTMVRTVVVGAGQATTTDFSLRLGEVSTVITVDAVLPQMRLFGPIGLVG